MNFRKCLLGALAALATMPAMAGGLLTNTNQSVLFLRNPARDGYIGIDGVYSNPAGVAFLSDGFHLSFNWQCAFQRRLIDTTNDNYALGIMNNGATTKHFVGKASAPFIPSVQAAYNKGKWSYQFNFSVTGGGGKCEFADGLGSFETAVADVASSLVQSTGQIKSAGIPIDPVSGYSMDSYMQGRQFYYGFTLGAAYKLSDHLSLYGGLRVLYGTASYKAKIDNIKVATESGTEQDLTTYFNGLGKTVEATAEQIQQGITQYVGAYMAAGMTQTQAMAQPAVQALLTKAAGVKTIGEGLESQKDLLEQYANGVNLQSDQSGLGIAPIFGVDYKTGNFNFSAKYEFRTRMQLKNKSTVKEASMIEAVNKFKDGTKVDEDSPALLTFGAQWEFVKGARVSAGYHHFYDKQSHKYASEEKLLKGGTNEYLGGIEADVTSRLQASAGFQITRYGLSDEYMNDMSFVTNSWTFGFGVGYKVTDKVMVNAAYFQTNYDKYRTTANVYTRTNKVIGVGVDIDF